jgi:hypothetical protein
MTNKFLKRSTSEEYLPSYHIIFVSKRILMFTLWRTWHPQSWDQSIDLHKSTGKTYSKKMWK